jgi:hypothetical protein
LADLGNCTKGPSGTDCLPSPIDRNIHGYPVDPGTLTWTGTLPDVTTDSPNCDNWTSVSAGITGNGGTVQETGQGWTTGSVGPWVQTG